VTAGVRRALPATALLVAAGGVWQLCVWAFSVPDWLFPAPSAIAADFGRDGGLLARNSWVTVREVLLGYALAVAGGLALALLLHASSAVRRALYPILLASQTVPVVVLAPVLAIALGYDLAPKLVVVGLVCFFPVVVGAVDGLASVDEQYRRMMLTLDASRLSIFRRVEFPSALPSLFSGLRVAAAYASVGAVFGEWSGASAGLGYVMQQAAPALDTPRIFAAIAILSAISLALFALVGAVERATVPWAREERRAA
jgi:putative hydroxymethylpyrimidine transport system permease protein